MRNASPRNGNAISNTPEPRPSMGLAMSDLPPSAAIVRAARQIDLASSGKVSNSFSAALIHETGRVFRVTGHAPLHSLAWSDVVIYDNDCQVRGQLGLCKHDPCLLPPCFLAAIGVNFELSWGVKVRWLL